MNIRLKNTIAVVLIVFVYVSTVLVDSLLVSRLDLSSFGRGILMALFVSVIATPVILILRKIYRG